MTHAQIKNWNEHESKLRHLHSYLNNRIELQEHKKTKPSLFIEFSILLYYVVDILHLDGDYEKEIEEKYAQLSLEDITDGSLILETLYEYKTRIKNDIFSEFFSDKREIGLYRVDDVKGNIYFGAGENTIDFLNKIRKGSGEIHLNNPKQDIINVSECKHLKIDKNNQEHRCRLKRAPCFLANYGRKEFCPNLDDLVKADHDFFQQFIEGKYTVIENKS